MFDIIFYEDKKGSSPVYDYLSKLKSTDNKDSRIKANKIQDYIQALSEYGTWIGEPYIKHLDGEIWELRPLRDRILFAAWNGDSFILLHHFKKKSQKTPIREIKKAQNEYSDFKRRYQYEQEQT